MNKIYSYLFLVINIIFCASPTLVWLLSQMKYLNDEEIKSSNQVETIYLAVKTYLLVFLCIKMVIFVFEIIFFIYNLKKAKNNEEVFG